MDNETFFKSLILGVADIHAPELGPGVELRIRAATAAGFAYAYGWLMPESPRTQAELASRIAVVSVIDDEGKPLFTDADIPKLQGVPWSLMERIGGAARKLNGVGKSEERAESFGNPPGSGLSTA